MANLVGLSLLTVSRLLRENAAQVTSPYCQKTSLSRVSMWWNIWNKQSRNKCISIHFYYSLAFTAAGIKQMIVIWRPKNYSMH